MRCSKTRTSFFDVHCRQEFAFIIVKGEIYLIFKSNSNFCNELTEGLVFNKLFSLRYLNLASSKILVEAVLYRVVLKCM